MADTETKRQPLTEEQKAEVRALMTEYRQSHPGVELQEVLTHLDVPYKDQITVGVLRGLVPRKRNEGTSARSGNGKALASAGKAGAAKRPGRPTKRPASLEKVLGKLVSLRQEQAEVEQQIQGLETELRQRLETELGEKQAQRIFAS
jgi:hypothetical protein